MVIGVWGFISCSGTGDTLTYSLVTTPTRHVLDEYLVVLVDYQSKHQSLKELRVGS